MLLYVARWCWGLAGSIRIEWMPGATHVAPGIVKGGCPPIRNPVSMLRAVRAQQQIPRGLAKRPPAHQRPAHQHSGHGY